MSSLGPLARNHDEAVHITKAQVRHGLIAREMFVDLPCGKKGTGSLIVNLISF